MGKVIPLVLAFVIFLACIGYGCADVSRYTADEVISIAKDYAGNTCSGFSISGDAPTREATWRIQYRTKGTWVVKRTCLSSVKVWFFYESDGRFVAKYPSNPDIYFED